LICSYVDLQFEKFRITRGILFLIHYGFEVGEEQDIEFLLGHETKPTFLDLNNLLGKDAFSQLLNIFIMIFLNWVFEIG